MAVAALQGAIRAAREGRYGAVECIRRFVARACRNPRAELAGLDLADLDSVALVPQGDDPLTVDYVLTAVFIAEQTEAIPNQRTLVVEVSGGPFPPFAANFSYGRTVLTR